MILKHMGTVRTVTGSVYDFFFAGAPKLGGWKVRAPKMSINSNSKALGGTFWPIEKPVPWPPILGSGMAFFSKYFNDKGHRYRMPGGGKITSNVSSVKGIVDDIGE